MTQESRGNGESFTHGEDGFDGLYDGPGPDRTCGWLQSSLSLRVSGAGVKSWVIRYRTPDHRQMRLTLGKYPAVSLHDARALAMDMLLSVAHGGDPATVKRQQRAAPQHGITTFAQLAEFYQQVCAS